MGSFFVPRYCNASATCVVSTRVDCARSAMVLLTFKIRVNARAERWYFSIAILSNSLPCSLSAQAVFKSLVFSSALQVIWVPLYLCNCFPRAARTRALIFLEDSDSVVEVRSSKFTLGTSTVRSILSRMGPDTFWVYLRIWCGVQIHMRFGSVRYPHGQGFIAAISINCAGNVTVPEAREMEMTPSCSG